jgi:hypothetical protein
MTDFAGWSEQLLDGCEIKESVLANGPAHGARQLEMRAVGGVDLRVLPDRGFDIPQAWWKGMPIAWAEPARELLPTPNLSGVEWLQSFAGGLLTTCGLRHVGQPRNGQGLHGRFSHQRAEVCARSMTAEAGRPVLSTTARIFEPAGFGSLLGVERTVSTRVGEGKVELRDVVFNDGYGTEGVELLYHLNFPYRSETAPQVLLNGVDIDYEYGFSDRTVSIPVPSGEIVQLELLNRARNVVLNLSWDTTVLEHLQL